MLTSTYSLLMEDPDIQGMIDRTKAEMTARCQKNVDDINQRCSYGGESFEDYRKCFEASKEWLRYKSFPSCYSDSSEDD